VIYGAALWGRIRVGDYSKKQLDTPAAMKRMTFHFEGDGNTEGGDS
jgi:hypothetical protein